MILAAATHEPNAGWGKLLALVGAAALFWLFTTAHGRYKSVQGKPLPPADEPLALEGVNPQVNNGSDPNLTPSPAPSGEGVTDLDGFVKTHVATARPTHIIKAARTRFGVSESTVKRRIRAARGGQQ